MRTLSTVLSRARLRHASVGRQPGYSAAGRELTACFELFHLTVYQADARLNLRRSSGERLGEVGEQGGGMIQARHIVAQLGEPQGLGPLPAAHIQDTDRPVRQMAAQLPRDKFLMDGIG